MPRAPCVLCCAILSAPAIAGDAPEAVRVFRDVCAATAPVFGGADKLLAERGFHRVTDGLSRSVHVIAEDYGVWLRGDPERKAPDDLIAETGRGAAMAGDADRRPGTVCLVLGLGLTPDEAEAALSDMLDPDAFLGESDSLLHGRLRVWRVGVDAPEDRAAFLTVSGSSEGWNSEAGYAQVTLEIFDASPPGAAGKTMP